MKDQRIKSFNNNKGMKKEQTIRIFQISRPSVMSGYSDIEFTIVRTASDTLEARKWEKHLNISEDMTITRNPNIFDRMLEENAVEVFRQFYKENFTKL